MLKYCSPGAIVKVEKIFDFTDHEVKNFISQEEVRNTRSVEQVWVYMERCISITIAMKACLACQGLNPDQDQLKLQ